MSRALAALFLLTAACTDYAVHVSFDIPDAYQPDVATTRLAVIVPPAAEPFGCEQLAFGEVDADTVALATVQEATGSELAGIPRTGTKLFHAVGLDAQELPLVAGCEELGEVDGVVDLLITGEPTTVVAVPPSDPGKPLRSPVTVTVIDGRGDPLASAEVRYTVTGPAAETTGGTKTTDALGRADIQPEQPSLPGPQALDVRARWARTPPDSLLGFGAPPGMLDLPLPGTGDLTSAQTEALYVVGRIGPAGQVGFAALGPVDPINGGRQVLLTWYDAALDPPFDGATTAPLTGVLTLGLIDEGDGRDRVFTLTATSWIEIAPSGGTTATASPSPGHIATRILPAGGCSNGGDNHAVLVSFSDGAVQVFDANRDPVAGSPLVPPAVDGLRIAGSGCVTATGDSAGPWRTVVYSDGTPTLQVVSELDGGRGGPLTALALGVGFSPALGGADAYLLASEVDVDGLAIARWRLSPFPPAGLELEKVDEDESASPALSVAGGDVDGDGEVDVVGLLTFGERDAATQFRVLVALAVPHGDGRLTGLSEPDEATRPRMFLRDFDGDGFDDLLLATPERAIVLRLGP